MAQDGDVQYVEVCFGQIDTGGEVNVAVDIELWGGPMWDSAYGEGFGYAEAQASGVIGATDYDQNVGCAATFFMEEGPPETLDEDLGDSIGGPHDEGGSLRFSDWIVVGYEEMYWTEPSAGPGTLEIEASAFIEENWVPHPAADWVWPLTQHPNEVYEGDDRSDFRHHPSTYRVTGLITINNTAIYSGFLAVPYWANAHETAEYDRSTALGPDNRLKAEAKAQNAPGDMKLRANVPVLSSDTNKCDITYRGVHPSDPSRSVAGFLCRGEAVNGLFDNIFMPRINWRYQLGLVFGQREINWTLPFGGGCHDGFPSYELNLNGDLKHSYHEDHTFGLWALYGSCDVQVDQQSGVIR